MPITVGYSPSPALIGQGAYAAGLGDYAKSREQYGLQLAEYDQRERMQRTSLDASAAQQAAQIEAARQQQAASIDANRQNSIAQMLATRVGQESSINAQKFLQGQSLDSQRSNLEYSAGQTRSNLEFSTQADFQKLNTQIKAQQQMAQFEAAQQNARLQAQLSAQQQNMREQLQAQRVNNLSQIYAQQANLQTQIANQQQMAMYANYARQEQAYQEAQYQSALREQQFAQQQALLEQQYGNQAGLQENLYGLQQEGQDNQLARQMQMMEGTYNFQQGKIQSAMEELAALGPSDGWNDAQKQEAMFYLQQQMLSVDKVKQLRADPWPEGQGVGQVWTQKNPATGQAFVDGRGNPIPFTRTEDGTIQVVRGWSPQQPEKMLPALSPKDLIDASMNMEKMAQEAISNRVKAQDGKPLDETTEAKIRNSIYSMFSGIQIGTSQDGQPTMFPVPKITAQPNAAAAPPPSFPNSTPGGYPQVARPMNEAEFNALPAGTMFYAPDGTLRRK